MTQPRTASGAPGTPGAPGATPAPAPAIRLLRLVKQFGRRRALDGIDLELTGRQIVGVVGPDGAGKTTLLRSLAGLLEVEAEEAKVLGHDLRDRDVTGLKAMIGYVPQAFSLHRELSVMENLRFTARLHRLPASDFEPRSAELLERTGLAAFTDRPAGKLSGGMKHKLAMANALLTRAPLLVLDEPTAGVDVLARSEIWAMLERERAHALIVIATSYLDEAAASDRLVYLDRGKVIAIGTPDELRERVPLELYRAWGDDPRAIAREARRLPYVAGARATGGFARIEVKQRASPGAAEVIRALTALSGAGVRLAEQAPVDMESTLLALARGIAA